MKRHIINAGVQVDADSHVVFDWDQDMQSDVIHLVDDTSGEFDKDNIRYIYGYSYSDTATASQRKIVRNYLKHVDQTDELYSENISEFVERAVLRLDERCPLNSFEATVHIESTKSPSLVDIMREWIWEYSDNVDLDFKLIKAAYDDVEFDEEKARAALLAAGYTARYVDRQIQFTLKVFESAKQSGKLFEMRRFVPRQIRDGFLNFLKFRTEAEREAYAALQGVDVLIFDDFLTSGATVREVIRYLRAININNTLTVFVLIQQ